MWPSMSYLEAIQYHDGVESIHPFSTVGFLSADLRHVCLEISWDALKGKLNQVSTNNI